MSTKRNITILVYNTRLSGGNKIILEISTRLRRRGYDVQLLTLFGDQPEWFKHDSQIKRLTPKMLFLKHDILIGTFWPTIFFVFMMRANRKYLFVQAWEEDFYNNLLLKIVVRLAFRLPLDKIVTSKFLEQRILKHGPKNIDVYRINGCAINIPQLAHKKVGKRKVNTVKILSVVSWYQWYKGLDLLEKVVLELKKEHKNYKFTLVSCENKSYSSLFDRFISNPSLKKITEIYQNSDILLSTSRSEGFFLPGLEAMACGCIFITTNSGGVMEYVKPTYNAVVVDNISQLWKKDIIEKLWQNKILINKLIHNGHKTVKQFTWRKIMNDLDKILLKL